MATRWLDHGVYPAYNATPNVAGAWGIPQDGDGLAKALSTASSIAKITFSAVPTVGASPSITVMGVAFTSLATLTGAASANAAADALATLINNSGTALPTTIVAGGQSLRNILYARGPTNGAAAGSCEIMTRAGSALFNYAANTLCQITTANVNNVSSVLADQQFKGGVSGCYGYLFSLNTMWPTGISTYYYGLWTGTPSMGGYPLPGDTVYIRSGKTIAAGTNVNANMSIPDLGTVASLVTYIYDDATEWPADGVEPVLRIQTTNSNGAALWNWYTGGYVYHKAKKYASGQRNVVFEVTSANGTQGVQINLATASRLDCIDLYGIDNGTPCLLESFSTQYGCDLFDCRISWPKQRTGRNFVNFGSSGSSRATFHGGVIEVRAATDWHDGIIANTTNQTAKFVFSGTAFKGFIAPTRLIATGASWAIGTIVFLNCSFNAGITDVGPSFKSLNNNLFSSNTCMGVGAVIISNTSGNQENIVDNSTGFAGWWSTGGYPTLSGLLRNGSPYSFRIAPNSVATTVALFSPLESPRIGVRTSAAANTVKVNLLVEKTLAWTTADIEAVVTYQGTDGLCHEESNWSLPGVALTPNTAAWTNLGTDPADSVARVNYAGIYFNRFEMAITTSVPIQVGTDVIMQIRVHSLVANSNQQAFACPQLILSQV